MVKSGGWIIMEREGISTFTTFGFNTYIEHRTKLGLVLVGIGGLHRPVISGDQCGAGVSE